MRKQLTRRNGLGTLEVCAMPSVCNGIRHIVPLLIKFHSANLQNVLKIRKPEIAATSVTMEMTFSTPLVVKNVHKLRAYCQISLGFYQDWQSCPVGLLYSYSHTSIKNGNRKIYWLTWEFRKGVQMFPWSKPTMMLKRWLGMRQQRRCLSIRRASSGFHQPYPHQH